MGDTTRAFGSRIRAWADRNWSGSRPDSIAPTVQLVEPVGYANDRDVHAGMTAVVTTGDPLIRFENESSAQEWRITYLRLLSLTVAETHLAIYRGVIGAEPGEAVGTSFRTVAGPLIEYLEVYVSGAGASPYGGSLLGTVGTIDLNPFELFGTREHPLFIIPPGESFMVVGTNAGGDFSLVARATVRELEQ